jgi:hypothetical protein
MPPYIITLSVYNFYHMTYDPNLIVRQEFYSFLLETYILVHEQRHNEITIVVLSPKPFLIQANYLSESLPYIYIHRQYIQLLLLLLYHLLKVILLHQVLFRGIIH